MNLQPSIFVFPLAMLRRRSIRSNLICAATIPSDDCFYATGLPLGLAERWGVAPIAQVVRVMPDLVRARNYALYLIRSRQVDMEKRRKRQRGIGREFEALREYRQGDEMRTVYWPATARRHELITRTFQVERSQAVWIVLDSGRLLQTQVYDPAREIFVSKLDYAVDAALALAQVAVQSGDRVGLVAYGRELQESVGLGRGAATFANHLGCACEGSRRIL